MSKLRLPRLQFSLRTLVIGMVIVAVLASWHGSRYARYRSRVAAKAELLDCGVQLATEPDAPSFKRIKFRDPESWLYRWDQFWFGDEAVWECSDVDITDGTLERRTAGKIDKVREALRQFPEIQSVEIQFSRSKTLPHFAPKLLADIIQLPNLAELGFSEAGELDAAWAACLPDKLQLRRLSCVKSKIAPAVIQQILERSPSIHELTLEQSMLNEQAVKLLNNWHVLDPDPYFGDETIGLTIFIMGADVIAGSEALAPCLKKLTQQYDLRIQRGAFDEEPLMLKPFPLCDFQVQNLTAMNVDDLTIEEFTRLTIAKLSYCKRARIAGCPVLRSLTISSCPGLAVENLAELRNVRIDHSEQAEFRNCPKLQEIHATGSLTLADLPSLELLEFSGKSLTITATPGLETVIITDPTIAEMAALAELPALRNLTLILTSDKEKPPPPEMQESLAKMRTLERLHINDHTPMLAATLKTLLPAVKTLPRLRVLWMNSSTIKTTPIFNELAASESAFPDSLELVLGSGPLSANVRQRYPRLTYLDFNVPKPFGGNKKQFIYKFALHTLPATSDLLRELLQQVPEAQLDPLTGDAPNTLPAGAGP